MPSPLEILAGAEPAQVRPLPPFAAQAVNFLADLSADLRAAPLARGMGDVQTFAFWCRRSNLTRMVQARPDAGQRLGRGLAFHVAPSNVPVNFAFTLGFGLLSGNANVVRLASRPSPQADVIIAALCRMMDKSEHAAIAARTALVRYDADSDWTAHFSAHCDVRVIWGGDDTVRAIRSHVLGPRAIDIAFPDRYSLCVMAAHAVVGLDEVGLTRLAEGFYNDTYLMDQNACSSPHLVVWQGDGATADKAAARFWPVLASLAQARYAVAPVQAVDKYTRLLSSAIEGQPIAATRRFGATLTVIGLKGLPAADLANLRGQSGLFWEVAAPDLTGLAPLVTRRFQTLTQFGLEAGALRDFVITQGLAGIDRIVPVGKALDMDLVWDGLDLVAQMSRIIDVRT